MINPWLTKKQAAKHLGGMSVRTIERIIKFTPGIVTKKIKGNSAYRVLISLESLEEAPTLYTSKRGGL